MQMLLCSSKFRSGQIERAVLNRSPSAAARVAKATRSSMATLKGLAGSNHRSFLDQDFLYDTCRYSDRSRDEPDGLADAG
jgi:hypothetical protein